MIDQIQAELPPSPRELPPLIPENEELKEWRQVYFHYTKADRVVPVLFKGLWSVSFSTLRGVNQVIESSGFSPTQEEEGWQWISVFDADDRFMGMHWHEVQPFGENVTVVVKKLPFKTKEPTAERKRFGEKLIKWRVAPRDIVALWVSESIVNQPISQFVDYDLSNEALDRIYKQFNQLARKEKRWNEAMARASEQASQRVAEKYPGANYLIRGEIAKGIMTKSLIYAWVKDQYQLGPNESMKDLLSSLENDSGVKIYVVKREEEVVKTVPLKSLGE